MNDSVHFNQYITMLAQNGKRMAFYSSTSINPTIMTWQGGVINPMTAGHPETDIQRANTS
jgi:hypothetical protein